MANTTISSLPNGVALTGAEYIPMDQTSGGATSTIKVTAAAIAALAGGVPSTATIGGHDLLWLESTVEEQWPQPVGQTGPTGSAGATGAQGPIGPAVFLEADSADPDLSFVPGPQGAQGSIGNTGATGPQGPIGVPGYDGDQGEDGMVIPGPAGPAGVTGGTGAQGPAGPAVFLEAESVDPDLAFVPGPQGLQGSAGTAGPQGPAGPAVFLEAESVDPDLSFVPGPQGLQGLQGTAGSSGAQGPAGPAVFLEAESVDPDLSFVPGPQGLQGSAGTTGSQGPAGPAVFLEAESVDPDLSFVPGPQGAQGPQGLQGSTGTTGAQGALGPGEMLWLEGTDSEPIMVGPPGMGDPSILRPFTVYGYSGNSLYAGVFVGSNSAGSSFGVNIKAGTTSADTALLVQNQSAASTFLTIAGNGGVIIGNVANYGLGTVSAAGLYASNVPVSPYQSDVLYLEMVPEDQYPPGVPSDLSVNNLVVTNNATLNGPAVITNSVTNTLSVTGSTNGRVQIGTPNTSGNATLFLSGGASGGSNIINTSAAALNIQCNAITALAVTTTGAVNCPVGLSVAGNPIYSGAPITIFSASNPTMTLASANTGFLTTTSSLTITIPANSSIPFPTGTLLTFVNGSATNLSIAITPTDTMTLANSTSTGTRTLAVNGVATAYKLIATGWVISGPGLT